MASADLHCRRTIGTIPASVDQGAAIALSRFADAEHAARAVRAVQFIELGDTQRAVQLLSGPIAHYYSLYGDDHRNDQRSKVRALIEQIARTNQVVAARIAEASTNTQFKTP